MKKLIISTFLSIMTAGAFAADSTVPFSYANNQVFNYGFSTQQRYDVAIVLTDPSLSGKKVKTINAYVSGTEGFSDGSVWMSNELKLEGKNIVPDICQESADIVPANYYGNEVGLISYTFEDPYVYNGETLYVGYSVNIESKKEDGSNAPLTALQRSPLLLSEGNNPNGLWIHGNSFPLTWRNYLNEAGGVAVIDIEFEGDFTDNCVSVYSIDYAVSSLGNNIPVNISVLNSGLNPVESIGYEYEIAGQSASGEITLPSPLSPNLAQTLPITIELPALEEVGLHNLKLTVTTVNGETNTSEFLSSESQVGILTEPLVNRPLVEEFTGLWCGWCPRGITGMEAITEEYGPDAVVLCYHYTGDGPDAMQVTRYSPVSFGGYPSCSVNRTIITDPYYGTSNVNFGILQDVAAEARNQAICDIKITDVIYDGENMTFTTETVFAKPFENANYKIGYCLTANGVQNENWGQANYFALASYAGQYRNTPLSYWTTLTPTVYGMAFNDVVINATGMAGEKESLPASINFNEVYTGQFTLQCQNLKNINDEPLPYQLSDAVINCFILDENGAVINSNKYALVNAAGVKDIETENNNIIETTYYDLTGRKINNVSNGIFIKIDKYNDGTTRSSKIAVK